MLDPSSELKNVFKQLFQQSVEQHLAEMSEEDRARALEAIREGRYTVNVKFEGDYHDPR